MQTPKQAPLIVFALLFSCAIPVLGYVYLGALIALLFLIGYLGGFFLWLLVPTRASYGAYTFFSAICIAETVIFWLGE